MTHLLTIEQLTSNEIYFLMNQAQKWRECVQENKVPTPYQHCFLAPLFFEDSTRTRISFEIAAKRLGFSVINTNLDRSSLSKGETFEDTALNLEALGCRVFVIRNTHHDVITRIATCLGSKSVVINAGSGCDHHPTQALLDFFTIQQHFKDYSKLKIAIVGDIAHSRVATSFLMLCRKLNIAEVRLVGPATLLPHVTACFGYPHFTDLKEGLANADVIMSLRIQKERIAEDQLIQESLPEYIEKYQINANSVKFAASHAIVMHPGPMNREIEMTSEVADGTRSVILEQAQNGIFVRMAVLDFFAKNIL